jgi:hypothetical protein
MTREEIEEIAILTCKTLGRFFAIYTASINDADRLSRLKQGNNKAYRFRRGEYDLSTLEYEKLLQLKADYENQKLININKI